MRSPHHIRAEKQIARIDESYLEAGLSNPRMRKPIPPNAYDDLTVSDWRGQDWARNK